VNDSPRRLARELVLKGLYAEDVSGIAAEDIIRSVVDDESLSEKTLGFAHQLFRLVLQHKEWADGHISALATNWDINRIANIDRNILRMAMVEIRDLPDTPVKVAINEAIELAKKFSTAESSSFINGILDKFARNFELQQKPAAE